MSHIRLRPMMVRGQQLQQDTERLVKAGIQLQKVCQATQVVNSPESFLIPCGVDTFKPRQSKGSGIKGSLCVFEQDGFDIRGCQLANISKGIIEMSVSNIRTVSWIFFVTSSPSSFSRTAKKRSGVAIFVSASAQKIL